MTDTPPFRFGSAPLPAGLDAEAWFSVEGDRLEHPIAVRLAHVPPARFAVTGVMIATDDHAEVTSETLRSIRLGALLEQLADHQAVPPDAEFTGGIPDGWLEWHSVHAVTAMAPTASAAPRRRGVAPTDDELRVFAHTYLSELQRRPHRAMTTAAAQRNLSRSTANRWAAICRDRGYLPEVPQGGERS